MSLIDQYGPLGALDVALDYAADALEDGDDTALEKWCEAAAAVQSLIDERDRLVRLH